MKLDTVIAQRANKTVYRDGDHAIKVFRAGHSKADVLNEALNQARVEETGLSIPRIVEVTRIDGCWAIVSEYIAGSTLAQLAKEHPDRKDAYLDRLVDLQLAMHAKRAPLLTKLYDKMERKLDQADVSDTVRYDLHTRLAAMPKHNKVCHGDFNPSNIVITPDDAAYILDWAHATQGNASHDAARTYLIISLVDGAEEADGYLDRFCEKSGIDLPYVQSWLPIVAASQSVKGKPEEREFLMRWVNVVDYE